MHFIVDSSKRAWCGWFLGLGVIGAAVFGGCSGNSTPPQQNDTTPPTVSVSAPSGGATVSGNVTVSANASDNVGVAGVQFLLDGGNLGAEVTSAPFQTTWNTTQSSNGAHTLSARARDAAGNTATSGTVNVTVSNAGPPLQLELAPGAVTGFTKPLDLQAPVEPAGAPAGRLFVVEQGGAIKIIQGTQVLTTPFLDIGSKISSSAGEEGLLGLAFHPQYSTNRKFYVNYTSSAGGLHNVIAEYQTSAGNPSVADPNSERILLTVSKRFNNHNGGSLAFGNDGFLYIALGDGGGGGDPDCNGQSITTLLGKILRIGVDPPFAPGLQYAIPPGNPFVNQFGSDEIWIYGLRNPFRFSFDRPMGDIWIGDVGQNAFEEVDMLTPAQQQVAGGVNLGWNRREGANPFSTSCPMTGTTLTDPIFPYSQSQGDRTVIGGYVYRGTAIPQLVGQYVFGDFISGRVWTLTQNNQGQWVRTFQFNTSGGDLSSFGQAQNGDLYVVRYGGGAPNAGAVARIRQVGTP